MVHPDLHYGRGVHRWTARGVHHSIGEGHTISSSVYFSAFFIATGFHGLHVTGGLVLFLFTLARTYMARRFTHEQAVTAMVVSYYWHFVDVVWIILFSVIYIVR